MQTHADRKITCALMGHTEEDYNRWCGHAPRTLLVYQRLLYRFVEEQISAGMRIFKTLLRPGAPLWMAEYVWMCRNGNPDLSLQLHVIRQKKIQRRMTPLMVSILECADKVIPVSSHDSYIMYARSLGLTVYQHSLINLRAEIARIEQDEEACNA